MRKKNVSEELVYGKIPPHARELEDAILGGILISPDCLPRVLNMIFAQAFYLDANQKIFKAIVSLYDKNRPVDILSVVEQLKVCGELESVGGAYYVTRLTNAVVSTANIEAHCLIVLQKFLAREIIVICGETISDAYSDTEDAFDIAEKADNRIIKVQESVLRGSIKDMNFYASKVYDEYETVKQTGVLGIQTGIIPFDKIFCGLVPPDLMIIAARPGHGKTSLALSLTHQISCVKKIPGAWFSLEMNGTQLSRRLASIDSKIPHEHIRQGRVAKEQEQRFYESVDRIGMSPVFIEDKSDINIRTIRTRANVLKRNNGIQYIVVDYLQLMSGVDKKNGNREGEISEISRGLKNLALELNLPIIALSQLSRKVEERSDKMPQLSDLRESGAIEQDADEVLFLMRPEYYEMTNPVDIGGKEYHVGGLCIAKGAKNRHGQCQNFALFFDAPVMQFSTHWKDAPFGIPIEKYSESNIESPF